VEFTLTRLGAENGLLWSEPRPDPMGENRWVARTATRTRDNALFAYAAGSAARAFCSRGLVAVATGALNRLIGARRRVDGGFDGLEHGRGQSALADTLCVVRALSRCHTLDCGRGYLELAHDAMAFIEQNFRCASAGYYTGAACERFGERLLDIDENISIARGAVSMLGAGGEPWLKRMALHALRYLCQTGVALSRSSDIGILLAEESVKRATSGDFAFEKNEFGPTANLGVTSSNLSLA
jgi:hypothetical protein